MKTTPLGRTAIQISVLGFGGMPLSIQGRPPEDRGRGIVEKVLDEGINFIDTADVYCLDDDDLGHNERLIASVVRDRSDRDRIYVATKGGLRRPNGDWVTDSSPKRLRDACEWSLRALGTERIFLYQLHAPPKHVPFEKSVETLAQLREEGKIEHVGLSNVSARQIGSAEGIVDIVSVQNRFNLYFREALEEGVIAECEARKITFLAYSPLGGKRLAKKLTNFPLLGEIAQRHGASPHLVALAWVRSKSNAVVPIPAASTVEHALDSIRAPDLELSGEEIEKIDGTLFSRS